jgi:hypothetical protein
MSNKIIIEDVTDILRLLIDENHWCKRSLCQDIKGNPILDPYSDQAYKWCIFGAIYALECSNNTIDYLNVKALEFGYNDLSRLNDLNEHYFIIQFLQYVLNSLGTWFKLVNPLYHVKKAK